jgi:hypothetical protein
MPKLLNANEPQQSGSKPSIEPGSRFEARANS